MSTCSIEKICSFKSICEWQFDQSDPNLPLKKQKDDENNSIAILMMKDILLSKPTDSSSPLQLDFKINPGYKLLVISFLCNSRFIEIYKGGEFYLTTSKGVITTNNRNIFEHEHAFSLPDLPDFRFKFLSVKAGWGGSGENEKEADFVIRDLKLMFELTAPVEEPPISQPIPTSIVAPAIPSSSSVASGSTAVGSNIASNLENANTLLLQEVRSLRQEIHQLKQLQPHPIVPTTPPPFPAQPPVASIIQSDAAILSLLNGLQHRLMKDLSDVLESKLAPIHQRLGQLEYSLQTVSNSLSHQKQFSIPAQAEPEQEAVTVTLTEINNVDASVVSETEEIAVEEESLKREESSLWEEGKVESSAHDNNGQTRKIDDEL
jgi:hypothetical protein